MVFVARTHGQRHTIYDTLQPIGGFLKLILTYSYCTKHNEINICHSDIQNHVSYKKNVDK